jgi:hypothetical protein
MSADYPGFSPESVAKFHELHAIFKDIQQNEGGTFTVKIRMLDGDVYVMRCDGYFNVQWFGKPEPFGFIINIDKEERTTFGPYHMH